MMLLTMTALIFPVVRDAVPARLDVLWIVDLEAGSMTIIGLLIPFDLKYCLVNSLVTINAMNFCKIGRSNF